MRGMAQSGAPPVRPLGGMQPDPAALPVSHVTERVRADGRPQPAFREDLRRVPSWRNAWAVLFVWIQTIGVLAIPLVAVCNFLGVVAGGTAVTFELIYLAPTGFVAGIDNRTEVRDFFAATELGQLFTDKIDN